MIALCFALAGLCVALTASTITLGVWLHSANKQKDAVRDLADQWKSSALSFEGDLRIERANVQVLTDTLESTKQLLAITQRQRDDLQSECHDHFVQRLQDSSPTDAAKMLASMVAAPVAGGVLPKTRRSEDPRDGLLPID